MQPTPAAEPGQRVRIYFDEHDHAHGRPLWSALLDLLRAENAAGAIVLRGMAGFGARHHLHTATLVDMAADLPLVLEWVDTEERVAALLPRVTELLEGTGGLITIDAIRLIHVPAHS